MPIIDPAFEKDALDLIMAVLLGGVIGFERQWRQRLAGLRTNTLVSLGRRDFRGFRWAMHRFQSNTGRRAGRHRHRFSRRQGDLEGRRQCTRPEHRGDALVFGRWRSVGRLRLLAPRHPRRRSRCRRQSRAAAPGRVDQPPADRVRRDRNLLCRQCHLPGRRRGANPRASGARFWDQRFCANSKASTSKAPTGLR